MTTFPSTVQERITLPTAPVRGGDTSFTPSAKEIVSMLRRRMFLIFVLFVLFSAAAVGGFAAWWMYYPGYRAECLIECVSNIPETELTVEAERLRQEEYERFVQTQALMLKSPNVLGAALKVTAVRETAWWRNIEARESKRPDEHLIELTEQLSTAPIRGTSFLRVSMVARKREDPAIIVNEVVRQWHDSIRSRSAEQFASQPLEAAQTELNEVDARVEEKRKQLRGVAAQLPPNARLNPADNIVAQQVEQYGAQVAQLSLEANQLDQYRQMYNDPEGMAVTAEDRAIVEQDPQVAQLAQFVFQLEQQRAADEGTYGSRHGSRRQLDAQVAAAQQKLADLRLEKLRERREDIREATNTAYLNAQHALLLAREKLERAEAALQDQDQLLYNYTSLDAELEQDLEYRLQLANYVKTLTRVVRQQSAVKVNIAQPAIDPLVQHSPNVLLLPVGIFLAIALAVGIGLALEMLDTSVRTSQDIVRHVDAAMLGAVPDTDDDEVAIKRVETAVLDYPRSMVAEAFRRIRTNLQFSAPPEGQRTILVTSPRPEDGKTTVACNLAIAVAQGGRRVLLIDANFRRPGLHKVFQGLPTRGFSNVLVGDATLDDTVTKSPIPTLQILAAGHVPPNPAELLNGETCRTVLKEAASRYDQVIIDTSPVLLASDALVLGPEVNGVIVVVRARQNSRGIARRACSLLTDVNARLFGVVLNAAQVTRGGYFREQLRDYYDYQTDVTSAAPKA